MKKSPLFKISYIGTFLLSIGLLACQSAADKNTDFQLESLIGSTEAYEQWIDPSQAQLVYNNSNIILEIQAGSFAYVEGNSPVKDSVLIKIRECNNPIDQIYHTLWEQDLNYTESNKGIFQIEAYANGKKLKLDSKKPAFIHYKSANVIENAQLFELKGTNWSLYDSLDEQLMIWPKEIFDYYPEQFTSLVSSYLILKGEEQLDLSKVRHMFEYFAQVPQSLYSQQKEVVHVDFINETENEANTSLCNWDFKLERLGGNNYKLISTANLKSGWTIYEDCSDKDYNATLYTETCLDVKSPHILINEVKAKYAPHRYYDKQWKKEVGVYKNKASFEHSFSYVKEGQAEIEWELIYQVCNSDICFPPYILKLSFKVGDGDVLEMVPSYTINVFNQEHDILRTQEMVERYRILSTLGEKRIWEPYEKLENVRDIGAVDEATISAMGRKHIRFLDFKRLTRRTLSSFYKSETEKQYWSLKKDLIAEAFRRKKKLLGDYAKDPTMERRYKMAFAKLEYELKSLLSRDYGFQLNHLGLFKIVDRNPSHHMDSKIKYQFKSNQLKKTDFDTYLYVPNKKLIAPHHLQDTASVGGVCERFGFQKTYLISFKYVDQDSSYFSVNPIVPGVADQVIIQPVLLHNKDINEQLRMMMSELYIPFEKNWKKNLLMIQRRGDEKELLKYLLEELMKLV